jgi:RNA polymerase sigma-70 factor (ECF subfamily)
MSAQTAILPNEKECFHRIALGDEAAFATMFYHYSSRISPLIIKITRSTIETEEIIQEVFVSIWKNRNKLKDVDNYAAYIFTIATNKTYNFLKVKARQAQRLHELSLTATSGTNNTFETIDFNESVEIIHQLVEQLTPQKKLIYKLTREEGLSHDEVATRLNISKNTVKNHLVETLRFLKDNMQKSHSLTGILLGIMIVIHS